MSSCSRNGLPIAPVAEYGDLKSIYCTSIQILTLAEFCIMTNRYQIKCYCFLYKQYVTESVTLKKCALCLVYTSLQNQSSHSQTGIFLLIIVNTVNVNAALAPKKTQQKPYKCDCYNHFFF